MKVKAWLDGDEIDLEDLVDLLPDGDIRVAKDDDGYYLSATKIDNRPAGVPYYEAARDVVRTVNGLGRAHNPGFRAVRLNGRYQDGDRKATVVIVGTAEARLGAFRAKAVGRVTRPDGTVLPPPPPPGPRRAALAATHPDVAEALALMGQPTPLGWVELYKVYEIVRDAVRPTKLEKSGLATKAELKAFTGSANRPDVSGADARHARPDGALPPTRTMTLPQGRQFIGDLVCAWLDSLA
ncbi:hypothetical protein [Micromonospora sp. NBC_01796]|uniref:hypothetical protein n=1 Tax=Micromonospora sp. NBC_01796 TaxID=2975987 RepID=UPI002DD9AA98|nr:hypothetical protein [Micromonospora sp. NBC_01796]WSA88087.1 hypothetical protein OIE47_11010 [Micromonospora sp. NBC_01796]